MIDLLRPLAPDPTALIVGAVADLIVGDPVYAWHPVRLIGGTLQSVERRLRGAGLDGYGGGILLFVCLAFFWLAAVTLLILVSQAVSWTVAWIVHVLLVYTFLALGDLLHHVRRIESAVRRDGLVQARHAVSALVARDTDRMDGAACRRAAVESLSENLTDGFVSPVFWYVLAGLPGLLLFKIVSTMDSMVGYKTSRYFRFGWCGARLDDVMNYLPARLTWLVIAILAFLLPGYSGRKAWRVGLQQHCVLPGPNAGWSEAAIAGALERRIAGPIFLDGVQVTDLWVGDQGDQPLESASDVTRAIALVVAAGVLAVSIAVIGLGARS